MNHKPNHPTSRRIIRMPEVERLTSLKQARLYELISQGLFPRPFKIVPGGRAAGLFEHQVIAWLEQRAAASQEGK